MTKKHTQNAAQANKYPPHIAIHQSIHAFLLICPYLWVYFTFLTDLSYFEFYFPTWLRWLGVLDYIVIVAIMVWQMNHLSVNISATHQERFLVTSGPYYYVRHPLYSLFIFMQIDMFLITANWLFIMAIFPAIISSKKRADYEEKLLEDEYGEMYRNYKKSTGQLFPKFF